MARRRVNPKLNKAFRALGILGAVFALITSIVLIAFMVLDIAKLNALITNDARYYLVVFESQSQTLSNQYYHRGAKIVFPETPSKEPDEDEEYNYTYSFKGWDMTGDGFIDYVPHYAYYPFRATAVFNRKSIRKPQPSSDPNSSEEEPYESSHSSGGYYNG